MIKFNRGKFKTIEITVNDKYVIIGPENTPTKRLLEITFDIGLVKRLMPKTYKDMEKAYIKQYGMNGIDDFSRLRLVMDSKKK